jgi:pimeloyl-ACP methyl ester carboxylesterase
MSKLLYIGILIVILLLVIIGYKSRERFSVTFEKSAPSIQSIQEFSLDDHSTMIQLQKGNSGKTVLLLHNSPMNLNMWQPLFQTLQAINMSGIKTPNVLAYDLRGHGTAWMPVDPKFNDSNINNTAWTSDQFVEDCKKIYDEIIGTGKIILCGFGFGGLIAQLFALKYPDLTEKLVLLQTTIRPMPAIQDAINYLSGSNGWIAQNPSVTYLTDTEEHIKNVLCEWFHLPDCPSFVNTENDQNSPHFSLAEKMWRQASSTTNLQTLKLLSNTDVEPLWVEAKNITFPVHILTATGDPMAPPDRITETYTAIYNTNRQLIVALDIVDGKHGFTIMHPEYIAKIICQDCMNATISEES